MSTLKPEGAWAVDLTPLIDLHDQVAVDKEYAVQVAVPDSLSHVQGWIARSAEARERYDHRPNVLYGPTLDEYIDIFPSGAPNSPIHVFFHGGYWKLMSAKEHSFIAPVGLQNGWTTVIVNYSLCPKVRMPEIVRQTRAAVAWVHRHAAEMNGNSDRIVVSGHSAGGHIVGRLLATDWARNYGLPERTIAGALPISGLFDLEPIRWTWLQPGLQLSGADILEESPVRNLHKFNVPVVVAVGGSETPEFLRQSAIYSRALEAVGLTGEYVEAPGRHHFNVLDDLADAEGCLWKRLSALA